MIDLIPKSILRFCAVLLFFAGLNAASFATPLEVAWTADLNITSATFHSIIETSDGGFLLGGSVTSMTLLYKYTPAECGILVKTDKLGHVTWTARVLPTEEKVDYWVPWSEIRTVKEAPGGNSFYMGNTGLRWTGPGWPIRGPYHIITGRADPSGKLLSEIVIGDPEEEFQGFDMIPLEVGGYVVLGGHYKDGDGNYVLIRLDSTGKMLDFKPFRQWGGEGGKLYSIAQAHGGGYIMTGEKTSDTLSTMMLLRTDVDGNALWEKSFRKEQNTKNAGVQAVRKNDGGYLVAGMTGSDYVHRIWLVGVDSIGNRQWDLDLGEPGSSAGIGWLPGDQAVYPAPDGEFLVAGSIGQITPPHDNAVWLLKIAKNGSLKWQKKFRSGFSPVSPVLGCVTRDGGYVVLGRLAGQPAGQSALIRIQSEAATQTLWSSYR